MNKGIGIYKDFVEAHLARGRLLFDRQKWERALKDFVAVQRTGANLAAGYIGAGECLEALGDIEPAIKNYTKAMEVDAGSKSGVLFKRGRLYYKMRQLDLGIKDILEYVNEIKADNVQALLMLGKMQTKVGNTSDALINFEQVVKYDREGTAGTAIAKMAKIKLKQKDFYGAHYTLQRPANINTQPQQMAKLTHYSVLTEAVLCLIKRKPKNAVRMLKELLESEGVGKYVAGQAHVYAAYGYMSVHEFEVA